MPSLRIGDEENAILLIQQSQTDPQKAVAELVENSIDARARNVAVTRYRRGENVYISVMDDGEGVRAGGDGGPDVESIATHLCDSIKRRLEPRAREGIQGQFGIGLLGFAAVGEELVLSTRREGSRTRGITLHAYRPDYELDKHGKELRHPGTEVEIRNVRTEIQHRLTGEKLHRYLSDELGERVRKCGTRVLVEDRVGIRRQLVVQPPQYRGNPLLSGRKAIETSRGLLRLDLYSVFLAEGDKCNVAVCRNGTRLLVDILECEELRRPPWDRNLLEGTVDFAGLTPAPTTRRGFLLDESYREFLRQLEHLAPAIELEIEKLAERREQELDREFREKLEEAFAQAMEELPSDYSWFEKEGGAVPSPGKGGPGKHGGASKPVRLSAGPLAEVKVSPKLALLGPNERRVLAARCFDPSGAVIPSGVSFEWRATSQLVGLTQTGAAVTVEAKGREGEVAVRVVARLAGVEKYGEARVVVAKTHRLLGFPPPDPVHAPMEPWRSRYSRDRGVLEINSGHRDYQRAADGGRRPRLKYVARLYAKELVLMNFAGTRDDLLLERMIEVTTAIELLL